MKYAAHFSNKIELDVFDEIFIPYKQQEQSLPHFLKEHSTQRIILEISDINEFYGNKEWEYLNLVYQKYSNFIICFSAFCQFQELPELVIDCMKYLEMPYMTGMKVTNFDQLNYICEKGVCSVYLAEEICFDLRRAKWVCDRYGVQIRAFANVAQGCIRSGPAPKKFFIRPEDVEEYSDCIDIIEFWGPLDRQYILYRIYSKGFWYGDLNEIILDLNLPFDSRCIIPEFARIRKNCGRKCMRGGSCSICKKAYDFSKQLKTENRGFNYTKKD